MRSTKFKNVFVKGNRLSCYINKGQVEDLGWKQGDNLVMRIGDNGEVYLTKLDGIPVVLCENISTKQFFITFPVLSWFCKPKKKVRMNPTETGIIMNFF